MATDQETPSRQVNGGVVRDGGGGGPTADELGRVDGGGNVFVVLMLTASGIFFIMTVVGMWGIRSMLSSSISPISPKHFFRSGTILVDQDRISHEDTEAAQIEPALQAEGRKGKQKKKTKKEASRRKAAQRVDTDSLSDDGE